MKVHSLGDVTLERPEDKRQVETFAAGACPFCNGWGYPTVDFLTEDDEGKPCVRIKAPACRKCDGSGLNVLVHTDEQIAEGRAYHQARLAKLHKWLTADLQHKLLKEAGRLS